MSKFFKLALLTSILAIAIVFAFSPSPAQAAGHPTFDLYVKHNINGRSLGLDKALPVDVYANGEYVTRLSFGESFSDEFPADTYLIEVRLADEPEDSDALMTLGPVEIPAGVDVAIRATLGAQKTPTLRVLVK